MADARNEITENDRPRSVFVKPAMNGIKPFRRQSDPLSEFIEQRFTDFFPRK